MSITWGAAEISSKISPPINGWAKLTGQPWYTACSFAVTRSLAILCCAHATSWKFATWKWSQWPGLNRRPTVYETVALPLSYIGVLYFRAPLSYTAVQGDASRGRRTTLQ